MKGMDDEPTFKDMAYSCAKEVVEKTAMIEEQEQELLGVKRKLKEVVEEKNKVAKKLEKKEEKLNNVREEKKKEHDSLVYHRKGAEKAREQVMAQEDAKGLERQLREVQCQLEEAIRKCTNLESENAVLREVLEDKEKEIEEFEEERETEFDLMEGRRYKPEVVELIWELLEVNFAHGRVPTVIEKCFMVVKKIPKWLPTRQTIDDMNISRQVASQKHMEVELHRRY